MAEFDVAAVEAAKDEERFEEFVLKSEHFILKCASGVVHKYVSKSDDEWSIALSAFSDAVNTYDVKKSSFYSYAKMLITRNLIDYFRVSGKFQNEIVDEEMFYNNYKIEAEDSKQQMLKLEIEEVSKTFSSFGFTFMDLTRCSPKAEKTKKVCKKAVLFLMKNPALIKEMKISRFLPIKKIQENINVSRKILERHRKYIIAAIEILYGDYPYLSEYIDCEAEGDDEE